MRDSSETVTETVQTVTLVTATFMCVASEQIASDRCNCVTHSQSVRKESQDGPLWRKNDPDSCG